MAKTFYHDLTDSEWEKVKKKLPKGKSKGYPQIDSRKAFNGIMWDTCKRSSLEIFTAKIW